MVVQQKFNDLKDASHDDKKTVATSIAVFVVIILMIAWGFLFLKKVQRTDLKTLENGAVPTDQFDMNLIRPNERNQAQYDPTDDIRNLRNNTSQDDVSASGGGSVAPGTTDDFGNSGGF
ncbi:hypothetical protein JNK62_00195 [bacterium]|nr:hypothetical protein [bacterium]